MCGEKLTVTLRMREDCHFCKSSPIFNFEINHIQTPSHVGNIQNHLGGLQNLDESSHVLFCSFFYFFFQTSTAILVNASPLSLYIYIYIYMFVSVFIFNFDMYFDVSYALSKYQCHILLMYFHQALDINSNASVCLWWLSYSSK